MCVCKYNSYRLEANNKNIGRHILCINKKKHNNYAFKRAV